MTVQGATSNMRGQLYCGHALSSSPVVSALGSELDDLGWSWKGWEWGIYGEIWSHSKINPILRKVLKICLWRKYELQITFDMLLMYMYLGVKWRQGMWSKEENEQLKENILEYCKVRELEIGGRWGSQLVSALDSGLRGPCSRPGWVKVLCS